MAAVAGGDRTFPLSSTCAVSAAAAGLSAVVEFLPAAERKSDMGWAETDAVLAKTSLRRYPQWLGECAFTAPEHAKVSSVSRAFSPLAAGKNSEMLDEEVLRPDRPAGQKSPHITRLLVM